MDPQAFDDKTIVALTDELRSLLPETFVDSVQVLASVNSTNTHLMDLPTALEAGSANGKTRLCWALQQTAGKGRLGRTWQSQEQQALTFSLSFEAPLAHFDAAKLKALPSLSPATGLALARCLRPYQNGVKVKWPNDLWLNQQKIAGILIEATQRQALQRVVIGVGINLYWPPSIALSPRPGLAQAQKPGGLFDRPCERAMQVVLISEMAKALVALWRQSMGSPTNNLSNTMPQDSKDSTPLSDWASFDALADQPIALFNHQQCIAQGVAMGVDEDGALLVKLANVSKLARFDIGEVSLRHLDTSTEVAESFEKSKDWQNANPL